MWALKSGWLKSLINNTLKDETTDTLLKEAPVKITDGDKWGWGGRS
jgi:hypothetical protein